MRRRLPHGGLQVNRQGKTLTYINVRTFKCFGIQWTTGDLYNHRVWSALNRVDPKMARQYYFTTVNY